MAYTASGVVNSVFGNQRVFIGTVSADAAAGTVTVPGIAVVTGIEWCPMSMATDCIKVRANALAGGTASVGTIGFSGCASGDDMFITVYGR